MSITYGDIPRREACKKLMMVSFGTPSKNLSVYKFCMSLQDAQTFFENEYNKLLNKFGFETEPGKYTVKREPFDLALKELLKVEVTDSIPYLGITEDDFSDGMCEYPVDKKMWVNAADIQAILSLDKKIREGT